MNVYLYPQPHYVLDLNLMPNYRPINPLISRSSYATHLLDHLTTDGAGLTAGEVAVVTLLEVYADFV